MLARAHTFTIEALDALPVTVEVDVRRGLPAFAIVGLGDAAVREARERVAAAIVNSGFEFPAQRITANLAPAHLRKAGPGLDLAIACCVLAASGQVSRERMDSCALLGELSLDGQVRACEGVLAAAAACAGARIAQLALAPECAREASLADCVSVVAVERLASAVRVLNGGRGDRVPPVSRNGARTSAWLRDAEGDLADVRGQHHAVRALLIAAAGGHNILLSGSPGTGKTMLAHRLPSILPPLAPREAVEVTRIHGMLDRSVRSLERAPPFRAPHHSTTAAGLIGAARRGWVGEAVLAHNGVLFLDELSEFPRATLDALRQPLEEGRVAIARARHAAVYPARFMLIAATNPCPCGFAGERERCTCSEGELARYRRRLSGPLLDRIDLLVSVSRPSASDLGGAPAMSSAAARALVLAARAQQSSRLREQGISLNAHMDTRAAQQHARLDRAAQEVLLRARERGLLSARGELRALRVARTIADLRSSSAVSSHDLRAALAWRTDALVDGRVA